MQSLNSPSQEETTSNPQTETERLLSRLDRERRARVEAERLLEEKSAELYDAAERLKSETRNARALASAVEAATDGIALLDDDGLFTLMNAAHAVMFGYGPGELIGLHWSILYTPHVRDHIATVAMSELAKTGRWSGEVTGVSKHGQRVSQEIALSVRPGGGLICATRDIAPRLRRERNMRELESRLIKAEREAALFTIGNAVAHDFNNLIAAISGYAQLLKGDLESESVAFSRASRIVEAAEHATAVVRSLEIERTNDVRVVQDVDLARLLRTALDIADAIRPAHVKLNVELPAFAPARANDVLLSRAIINVVKNAYEAMRDPGTVTIRLSDHRTAAFAGKPAGHRLGPQVDNVKWAIEVIDEGPGVASEKLSQIFSPFSTTKGAMRGTGLGLLSLKALADSKVASVEVESVVGQGACFRILFGESGPDCLEQKHSAPSQDRRTDARILVVDDDQAVGEMLVQTLDSLGFSAQWLGDPRQALSVVEDENFDFDLLLTDHTMPNLNGDELARRVKSIWPCLPVILYSGQAGYLPKDPLFAEVLAKPISAERLKKAVTLALEASQ